VRVLATGAVSGAVSRLLLRGLRRSAAAPAGRWDRQNHRGEQISLLEGPAFVAGTVAALGVAPGLAGRTRCAALLATAAAGVLGAYDDLAEQQVRKGLAGHLGALARGEVTTGAVKVLGLAASGVAAAALVGSDARSRPARALDALVGGAVVAGSANLLNLLDLRPGRALKATVLASPLTGAPAVAAAAGGAAVGLLPDDLAERTMLGDTGANAAGAALGVAAVAGLGRCGRWGLLAALVALTMASERVSFTKVIESTPVLREVDAWGRRPPGFGG
jgi:UDP-N-acetylmuramyl pentapeptide phosphotransferase/UDP-N-acetylglucosamine-1-phosphate transferase